MHVRDGPKRRSLTRLSRKQPLDAFIINHKKNNIRNDVFLDPNFDQRRLVFIGLSGPYQSWTQCPSVMLYSALFVIPLKRSWVLDPSKYPKQLQSAFDDAVVELRDFLDLLLWKDTQGLVFWMLDHHQISETVKQTTDIDPLIDPVWYCLSEKLSALYDPISGETHNPLILDSQWYQEHLVSKFDTNAVSILSELYFLTQKDDVIKEIVYQSNQKSIFPVVAYQNNTMYDLYTINE
eukprot:22272_1